MIIYYKYKVKCQGVNKFSMIILSAHNMWEVFKGLWKLA